jgi:hypothetical protein
MAPTPVSAHSGPKERESLASRLTFSGVARVFWNLGRLILVVAAVLLLVAVRNSVSWTTYALAIGVCFSALVITLGLRRDVLVATGYILGFAFFALLRGLTDETPVPVQFDYVIWLERLLPGPLPTIWMQTHLRTAGEVSPLDHFLSAIHLSYFFSPLIVGCALWRWRHESFERYVVVLLAVYYAGLVVSFLLPTAPPWLASNSGDLPKVDKVGDWVYGTINLEGRAREAVRMNPVAAMPSLHMAITTVVFLALARFGTWGSVVGASYWLLMAFALVYLGEHYVVDEVVGVILGAGVWGLVFRWDRGWRPAVMEMRPHEGRPDG